MYPTKKISEVCIIGPKKSEVSKLDTETLVSFVPMRDVKEGEKYFLPSESKKLSEVYSGYTYFNNEDVILAKVTPCFENGKSGIARDLENGIGFGSSEFYVFRCNPGVLPEYLYRVISSQKFLKEGADNMSGAVGLQRVTKEFIENYNFPLPPLSTQSKIVMKLDEAFGNIDRQISLLNVNIEDVESMRKSILSELFSGNYQIKKLQEVCEKITDGTHQTPTYFDSGYIFLSSKNVTSGKIDWNDIKYIDERQHQEMYKRVAPRKGDILLAKNGTTGVAAIVDRNEIFDIYVSLALIRPKNEIISEYLLYFINSSEAKRQFNSRLKGVGVPNLHLGEIKEVEIPLPPLPRQHEIVEHLDRVFAQTAELRSSYEAQIRDLETLRQSLLEEAFAGRLVSE